MSGGVGEGTLVLRGLKLLDFGRGREREGCSGVGWVMRKQSAIEATYETKGEGISCGKACSCWCLCSRYKRSLEMQRIGKHGGSRQIA